MASFEMEQDPARGISILRVIGELQAGELSEFMGSPGFAELGDLSLWDYRETTFASIPTEKLIEAFEATRDLVPASMRIACLYGSQTDFGIGRMYEGKAEFEGLNNEFEVFLDYDEALGWLLGKTVDDD